MALRFDEKRQKVFDELLTRYPTRQAALLPTLRLVEEQFGEVSEDGMRLAADLLGLAPAHVYGVLTFYTHYRRAGTGKYLLQVCSTLPCALLGVKELTEHIERRLGVACGETTRDGRFTLKKVECLGSCGTAPVVQVNDAYHEKMTPEAFDRLLETLV